MAEMTFDGITAKQEKAIIALLNEHNVPKAAERAGVGTRTIYNWLGNKTFAKAYRKARREAFGHAIALTQRYAPLAVNTLAQVMMDKDASHSSKVSAATSMLKFGRDGIELDDLAGRLEALEQAAEERKAAERYQR